MILMVDLGIHIPSNSCSFARERCVPAQFPDVDFGCPKIVPAEEIWVSSSGGESTIGDMMSTRISAPTAFCNEKESSQLESEKPHTDFYSLSSYNEGRRIINPYC